MIEITVGTCLEMEGQEQEIGMNDSSAEVYMYTVQCLSSSRIYGIFFTK